jgi:hypothetical protein
MTNVCGVPRCGRKIRSKGLCNTHYLRFAAGQTPEEVLRPIRQRCGENAMPPALVAAIEVQEADHEVARARVLERMRTATS